MDLDSFKIENISEKETAEYILREFRVIYKKEVSLKHPPKFIFSHFIAFCFEYLAFYFIIFFMLLHISSFPFVLFYLPLFYLSYSNLFSFILLYSACLLSFSLLVYTQKTFLFALKPNLFLQPGDEPKTVRQYHYTAWPEHGAPPDPGSVLEMLHDICLCNRTQPGPIVVHCRWVVF